VTKTSKIALYAGLILSAAIWLMPVYAMLTTSLKTPREVAQPEYVAPPRSLEIGNYLAAFQVLKRGLGNSVMVAIPATALSVLIGSWAGFALALLKFRTSNKVFFVTSIATFLPYQIILIPFTQFMAVTGLINTRFGLVVAYTVLNTPMAALITSTFFQAIPQEIQEAAMLDGCGPFTFYRRILLSMARLGILSTAILIFTMVWNEFLIATTLTQGPAVQTATPVLAGLRGSYAQLWHIQMAGATIASIPPMVIFIFLGRHFVAGLMAGTLKS
jgi:glucose/mannose transport system permease protein